MITYQGSGILIGNADIPTQLWITERFLFSIAFMISPFLLGKSISLKKYYIYVWFLVYLTIFILLSILYFRNFPPTYINDALTNFKIISEYTISLILFIDFYLFYRKRFELNKTTFLSIGGVLLTSIIAELCFTKYANVYGDFNLIGHIFVLISTLCIYAVFVRETLNNPYSLLFRELANTNKQLSDLATLDSLTGINNRRSVMEKINEQFEIAKRFGESFTIIMVDLDKFKDINDSYGHLVGDKVLMEFATFLKKAVRKVDIIGRYGGDEFIICPINANAAKAHRIIKKIERLLQGVRIYNNTYLRVAFTVGISESWPQKEKTLSSESVIACADDFLLKNKKEARMMTDSRESSHFI